MSERLASYALRVADDLRFLSEELERARAGSVVARAASVFKVSVEEPLRDRVRLGPVEIVVNPEPDEYARELEEFLREYRDYARITEVIRGAGDVAAYFVGDMPLLIVFSYKPPSLEHIYVRSPDCLEPGSSPPKDGEETRAEE